MNKASLILAGIVVCVGGCATTSKPSADTTIEAAGPAASSVVLPSNDSPPSSIETTTDIAHEASPLSPAPLDGLTIEEALRLAEEHHPDLKALRHRVGMAEGEAQQAGLWPNPTLSLGLEGYTPDGDNRQPDLSALENLSNVVNQTLGTQFWIPSLPEPDSPDQLQQVVNIAQPLPMGGAPRLARQAGLLETERWGHEYERARLELQSQVKKSFDDVVFQQARLATTIDLERTLGEILDVTRARLDAGDIAAVELIKGEADYERFALEVEAARTELDRAKSRLNRVLGSPNLSIQSCAGVASAELPDVPDLTLATLDPNHPQVRAWEAADDAAEAHVAVAKSRRLPVPTLGVGYRHYEFSDQDTFDVSLEFELPLFDRKQGDIRAAREKSRFEAASIESEKNDVEATLTQTVAGYTSHKRQAEAFEQRILPKMEETLSIARTRFEAGDTSMLEVLDAYRSLAEAKLAHQRELFEARANLHELSYLLAGHSQL